MLEKAYQHCEDYKEFLEALNTMDMEKIEAALREFTTQDYKLHIMGRSDYDINLEEWLGSFKLDLQKKVNLRYSFIDCFSEGDRMAGHLTLEWFDVDTNEKKKAETIFISHFKDGKVTEEWES